MKKVLCTLTLLAAFYAVNAQSAMSHGKWEENTHTKTKVQVPETNEFTGTEMSVTKSIVTFSDLPELSKQIWAIVTDANGEMMTQKRITPTVNYIDLGRLPKGEMYFISLMYKNKSQKGFVVHL